MATKITFSSKTDAILGNIAKNGDAFRHGELSARKRLLDAARSLIAELETPVESVTRLGWAEPTLYAALRTAINLKLFERLSEDDGGTKSLESLAKLTGADPLLVGRMMKHFVAMNIVAEQDVNQFASTKLSKALAIPKYRDGISNNFDCALLPLSKLPEFFARTDYKNPQDGFDCPFQYGHDTDQFFFDWIAERPELLASFSNHMAGYRQGRPSWMDVDFFPVEELLKGLDLTETSPLLVDVGGGIGHDVEEFKAKFPGLRGRLIVQDLPGPIAAAQKSPGIELMAHDFFTPQPVQGAKFYYLHSVLHDWSDEKCQQILTQLVQAMRKGYSKILINENVVPDKNAPWLMTGLDLLVMTLGAASERTEMQWKKLLAAAGLKIVKIWSHLEGIESLIEADVDS